MNMIKKIFRFLGPGFVTGASDDDPSGIATYAQTGAQFGYHQLWLAFFTYPFMSVIQEMCGRIGMVTGKGLAGVIRQYYPRPILYISLLLLVLANVVNIGADLGAMASALSLLIGGSFSLWLIVFTILSLVLQILIPYKDYSKYLKYLAFSLLAYLITAFLVQVNWNVVLRGTIKPHFSSNIDYLMNVVAVLGTTISPYLFFWQAGEEVEQVVDQGKLEGIGKGRPKIKPKDIHFMEWDTWIGMFFSNLIMFFIILTTASTLHLHHITQIETATQAAQALRPLAGDWAFLLFSIGIISTGLLAVPILAGSCAYAISDTFKWDAGLSLKFQNAKGFYGVIIAAMAVGMLTNFGNIPPFKMLYYTAVLNGLCAPPLMILIVLSGMNPKIMGEHTNHPMLNLGGAVITVLMGISSVMLILNLLKII